MPSRLRTISADFVAGIVVALVALPLCLGIAHASGAPPLAGLVSGILAGLVVSWLSGSHTSVSGPAAGLTAIVLHQIAELGSFEAFLCAVMVGGVLQIGMGLFRLGFLSAFVPSNIIKGLLAAIGIILILKQIPHALGHDPDFEGDFAFVQEDHQNTFTEIGAALTRIHPGAAAVGIVSLLFLISWERSRFKKSLIPAPLIVVVLAVLAKLGFDRLGGEWDIGRTHLVELPVVGSADEWRRTLHTPAFGRLLDPAIYLAGATIAIVASLETLLNLEATEKLDPKRRPAPANRELVAQGIGNLMAGALGGLPMTSVIVRSSVNIAAGARSRLAAFFHGVFLLLAVVLFPSVMNLIPLSALAAILVATGLKLATPKLFLQMWKAGPSQFVPFATTVLAIVLTDLLLGIVIGLGVGALFILWSNLKRPFVRAKERYAGGELVRYRLADQVSFLNRAALSLELDGLPPGSQVVLDARTTHYIDADVLELIREFRDLTAPAKGIRVSLVGFADKYGLEDRHEHVFVSTQEARETLSPADVLRTLVEGNQRFVGDQRFHREVIRQVGMTSTGQFPVAVTLSCIDSRTSVELLFDQGLGDVFSIRIAGNVAADKVLASIEYACLVAGAKLVVVLGHTSCGAITAACEAANGVVLAALGGCGHLSAVTDRLAPAIADEKAKTSRDVSSAEFVDRVAQRNVERVMEFIRGECPGLAALFDEGRIGLIGGMYDVRTGLVTFFGDDQLLEEAETSGHSSPAQAVLTGGVTKT